MDTKEFYRLTFKTVFPLMIQSLLLSSINFIGQAMVSKLGLAEIAAVGVANKIYSLFYLVLYGTCCACVMFISQYMGKKDIDGIRRTMGMTFTITVSLGILVTLITLIFPKECISLFTDDTEVIKHGTAYLRVASTSYLLLSFIYPINYMLRGIARVQIILCTSIMSVIINILTTYIFIFGKFGMPQLGVTGAALGTVITRGIELLILIIYLLIIKNEVITAIPLMFTFHFAGFKKFLYKALPLAGNEFFWGIGTTLYFVIYGHMGTAQLAAMSIISTIQTLEQTFSLSFSSSAAVIIGNEIGKGNKKEVLRCADRFHKLALYVGVFVSVMLFVLINPIVKLYQVQGTETGLYLTQCLMVMGGFVILHCYNSMNIEGLLRSGGDIKYVLLMDMGGIWLIGLPLTFIMGELLGLPIVMVYSAFIVVELYKLPMGIYRYRSHKWIHQLDLK
ncbi:MAG: MATE family efflux transporter [Anaerocolumna sp.]